MLQASTGSQIRQNKLPDGVTPRTLRAQLSDNLGTAEEAQPPPSFEYPAARRTMAAVLRGTGSNHGHGAGAEGSQNQHPSANRGQPGLCLLHQNTGRPTFFHTENGIREHYNPRRGRQSNGPHCSGGICSPLSCQESRHPHPRGPAPTDAGRDVDWVQAVADLQAMVAPEIFGFLRRRIHVHMARTAALSITTH